MQRRVCGTARWRAAGTSSPQSTQFIGCRTAGGPAWCACLARRVCSNSSQALASTSPAISTSSCTRVFPSIDQVVEVSGATDIGAGLSLQRGSAIAALPLGFSAARQRQVLVLVPERQQVFRACSVLHPCRPQDGPAPPVLGNTIARPWPPSRRWPGSTLCRDRCSRDTGSRPGRDFPAGSPTDRSEPSGAPGTLA